jgi:hypothetical protein
MDGECGVFEEDVRYIEGFYGRTGKNHWENLGEDGG